ncbi:MAG: alkaline phosphatase family protein [Planctomycetota bacterium]
MTHDNKKVLIFGLDAGEWSLVQNYVAEGRMPNFGRLMTEGAQGTLSTTAAQLPDTVWSCIYSGQNPAHFSKYFYVQYDAKNGDLRHVKDAEFTKRPFWDLLADGGRRVGVVDAVKIPMSDKPAFMIANWGAHATKAPRASNPPEILAEADRRLGKNPVGDVDRIDDTKKSRTAMRQKLLTGIKMRGELLQWLGKEQDWDVMFCGFSEMHQAGHHYWHGVDPHHPKHAEIVEQGLQNTVPEVYEAIDKVLGDMIEVAGEDALILVTAGHGMGPIWHASWNLQEMLDLLGYGRNPARKLEGEAREPTPPSFWRKLKMMLPGNLQYGIKAMLPEKMQDELLFKWYAGTRDWKGWRAHAIPNNDSCGAIRIALNGRDPHGIVDRDEYDAILDDLQQAFEELTDPVSGKKVVHSTTRLRDVFDGPYADEKPDLVICWEQSFPWHAIHSPRFGTIGIEVADSRTGSHTPRGFFLAKGPGIAPGSVFEGHSIYDLTPTILEAAGVEAPSDLDGRPIPLRSAQVQA